MDDTDGISFALKGKFVEHILNIEQIVWIVDRGILGCVEEVSFLDTY